MLLFKLGIFFWNFYILIAFFWSQSFLLVSNFLFLIIFCAGIFVALYFWFLFLLKFLTDPLYKFIILVFFGFFCERAE